MRPIYATILFCMLFVSVQAQEQGSIFFEEKFKLNIKIDGDMPEGMQLPKEQVNKKILSYNTKESIYKDDGNSGPTDVEQQTDGGVIKIRMDKPMEQSYCDIEKGIVVEQKELMTRKFLVTTELSKNEWKLTGQQKEIAGFPCQEATRTEGERNISVWFTPKLQVRTGPGRFAGLPGMVLAVYINTDEISIVAKEVRSSILEKDAIIKPTEGKKVTWEEFDKIRQEKMKEMEQQNRGNGNVIVKIRK